MQVQRQVSLLYKVLYICCVKSLPHSVSSTRKDIRAGSYGAGKADQDCHGLSNGTRGAQEMDCIFRPNGREEKVAVKDGRNEPVL